MVPERWRRWAAISTIAAVLEQKVWIKTHGSLYPNLYTLICGAPGTGKSRTIREVRKILERVPEFHLAPNSFTFPALIDSLTKAKRFLPFADEMGESITYNTLMVIADEIGTFLHKYEREMADGISALYDNIPYGHERRGNEIKIKIHSPQLNLLCGLTPATMMDVVPEAAWGQGLMSRMIMVYADEVIIGDDFANPTTQAPQELIDDLLNINTLFGEFKVTEDYRKLILAWREAGEVVEGFPLPAHPKLLHYNSRRRSNLYKLSMIASVDKSDVLLLDRDAFNTAMGWLVEAESEMHNIFKAGVSGADGKAMEEILFLIKQADKGAGVGEHVIHRVASQYLPIHAAARIIEVLEKSGMIEAVAVNRRTGARNFKVAKRED